MLLCCVLVEIIDKGVIATDYGPMPYVTRRVTLTGTEQWSDLGALRFDQQSLATTQNLELSAQTNACLASQSESGQRAILLDSPKP